MVEANQAMTATPAYDTLFADPIKGKLYLCRCRLRYMDVDDWMNSLQPKFTCSSWKLR